MIAGIASVLALSVVMVLASAGSVLLVRFWAGHMSAKARIFLGAIAAPGVLWGMISIVALQEKSVDTIEIVGFITVFGVMVLLIGLPVSLLATRKLDRMLDTALVPDTAIFE